MVKDNRPTVPVVDDKERTQGGFSGVAEVLNRDFPNRRRPISRQLVHKWWIYREKNEFPEAVTVRGTASGGKGHSEFNYTAVVEWYRVKRANLDKVRYTQSRTTAVTLPAQHTTTGEETLVA